MENEELPPLDPSEKSADDPVFQMLGVGEELWAEESGDAFVARERQGWEFRPPL